MKAVGVGAAAGALLGAVVGLIVHFMSQTVPSTYYITATSDGHRVDQTLASPLVHPSWWPSLPISVSVGVVVGALAVLTVRKAGYLLVRRPEAEPAQEQRRR